MNITGIRPYEAIGLYANKIGNVDAAAKSLMVEPGEYLDGGQESLLSRENSPYLSERSLRQNETSYDFAQKYDPTARYDMKGSESDLESLDYVNEVPKAYKDEVLRQYRMFVGTTQAEPAQQENQSSRAMEDFTL